MSCERHNTFDGPDCLPNGLFAYTLVVIVPELTRKQDVLPVAFTREDEFRTGIDIANLNDGKLEVVCVRNAVVAKQLSQFLVSAVPGSGVGRPSLPKTNTTVSAADVLLAVRMISNNVNP